MRKAVFVVLVLTACGGGVREPEFPASVPPGWTKSAVKAMDVAQFPELVRNAGVSRAWQAEYREPDGASARVDVYAIRSGTQGLDLVQRWRPEKDNAQMYTEHYLLNVAWQQAKRDDVASLVRSLPKLLDP
jgi:hypothetical protein